MQFKAVPEEKDLQDLVLQFQFFESPTTAPRTLTLDDIAAYNRDGYLKQIRVLSNAEVVDFRCYFDDLLAKVIAAGGDSYSISTAHLKHGRVYDLLKHPKIVAIVKDRHVAGPIQPEFMTRQINADHDRIPPHDAPRQHRLSGRPSGEA